MRESMFYGLYGLSMGGFENGARSGGCRSVGDTWVFRVCGGRPAIYRISTSHREKAVAARGPFEGNTEVTVHGNHFLPSWHLQCQLQDPLTGAKLFVPGHYDTARRIRCVTPRVEPLPGGGEVGNHSAVLLQVLLCVELSRPLGALEHGERSCAISLLRRLCRHGRL